MGNRSMELPRQDTVSHRRIRNRMEHLKVARRTIHRNSSIAPHSPSMARPRKVMARPRKVMAPRHHKCRTNSLMDSNTLRRTPLLRWAAAIKAIMIRFFPNACTPQDSFRNINGATGSHIDISIPPNFYLHFQIRRFFFTRSADELVSCTF
jgi:hypothetical protein